MGGVGKRAPAAPALNVSASPAVATASAVSCASSAAKKAGGMPCVRAIVLFVSVTKTVHAGHVEERAASSTTTSG